MDIAERFSALQERVARACAVVGRNPSDVAILAAVKTQTPERVVEALAFYEAHRTEIDAHIAAENALAEKHA